MQHQQPQNDSDIEGPEVNGVTQAQLNGSVHESNSNENIKSDSNGHLNHNGLLESTLNNDSSLSKPNLSVIDQEIVRLIGQHLIQLGLQ